MKLKHILTEDLQSEKRLDIVADYILRAIKDSAKETDEGKVRIGKIWQLIDDPAILGPLFNRLRNVSVAYTLTPDEEKVAGEYLSSANEILITYFLGKQRLVDGLVHSTIVHELRHALDHSLSKGKAFIGRPSRSASQAPPEEGDDGNYYRYPEEINARASEAMLLVRRYILRALNSDQEVTPEILKKAVLYSMDDKHLIKVFKSDKDIPFDNKSFRRLFNRILQYAEDFLARAKAHKNK